MSASNAANTIPLSLQKSSSECRASVTKSPPSFAPKDKGEAANISGQKESDVASIISVATKDALKIEGEADAEAARIYTGAYSSPDAQELFLFRRSLEVARTGFEKDTTAIFSTNSDLGRIFKTIGAAVVPAKPPAP